MECSLYDSTRQQQVEDKNNNNNISPSMLKLNKASMSESTNNKKLENIQELKKSLTLDFTSPESAKKSLQTPDLLSFLNLTSPELQKFLTQGVGTVTTPTPTQFIFPKNVTAEQEQYARGFIDALNELHRTHGFTPAIQKDLVSPGFVATTIVDPAPGTDPKPAGGTVLPDSSSSTGQSSGFDLPKLKEDFISAAGHPLFTSIPAALTQEVVKASLASNDPNTFLQQSAAFLASLPSSAYSNNKSALFSMHNPVMMNMNPFTSGHHGSAFNMPGGGQYLLNGIGALTAAASASNGHQISSGVLNFAASAGQQHSPAIKREDDGMPAPTELGAEVTIGSSRSNPDLQSLLLGQQQQNSNNRLFAPQALLSITCPRNGFGGSAHSSPIPPSYVNAQRPASSHNPITIHGSASVAGYSNSPGSVHSSGESSFNSSASFDDNFSSPASSSAANNAHVSNSKGRGSKASSKGGRKQELNIAPSGGQGVGYPLDLKQQEIIKLERKRARNRVAASKCRERKIQKIETLSEQVERIEGENAAYAEKEDSLRVAVEQLEKLAQQHRARGCRIEWQQISVPKGLSTAT